MFGPTPILSGVNSSLEASKMSETNENTWAEWGYGPAIFSKERFWAIIRLMMGWIFMWPFLDKLLGLGWATAKGSGYFENDSTVTFGYLKFGTVGPFADLFAGMAENAFVEFLFMFGLLGIGLSLLLGMGVRIGGYSGFAMLMLMYISALPMFARNEGVHNPFLDDHIIYGVLCLALAHLPSGDTWGLGKWWRKQSFVEKYPFLI